MFGSGFFVVFVVINEGVRGVGGGRERADSDDQGCS